MVSSMVKVESDAVGLNVMQARWISVSNGAGVSHRTAIGVSEH